MRQTNTFHVIRWYRRWRPHHHHHRCYHHPLEWTHSYFITTKYEIFKGVDFKLLNSITIHMYLENVALRLWRRWNTFRIRSKKKRKNVENIKLQFFPVKMVAFNRLQFSFASLSTAEMTMMMQRVIDQRELIYMRIIITGSW